MSKETQAAEDADSRVEIDVGDPAAVARWSAALGSTDSALLKAVQMVGPRIDKVKDYLGAGGMADQQVDG